jgi:DNA polymerase III epsilon subunit-like protein
MQKKYISVDIESTGSTPGKYSMISLGACIVGNTSRTFYREIQPLNRNFVLEALKVSAKGLKCLDNLRHLDKFNPESPGFEPERVIEILYEKGEDPKKAMEDFADWIIQETNGFRPVEAAAPIKFDGMFTAWYFDNFLGRNPFGHSGEDINSLYRGAVKDLNANIKQLGIRTDLPHNALEDAIIQAKELERVLELIS